jgi:hypothetical protein
MRIINIAERGMVRLKLWDKATKLEGGVDCSTTGQYYLGAF